MSQTITPNKTDSVSVITHQVSTHPTTIVSTTQAAATKRMVRIFMFHGYVEATADTNPGSFKVQINPEDSASSVNEHWITVGQYTARGTTPDTEAFTATEPAGETVLAVASTTGFAVDDLLYLQDTGTLADSEWAECRKFASNTSITLVDGLTTQKDSADVIWNDASRFQHDLNLEAGEQWRVVWSHEGATGADGHIKVLAVTYDSDTSA